MFTWLTSDLHLYHTNIREYCRRPYDSDEEMRAGLLKNYNSVVEEDDDVLFLGDMWFNSKTEPGFMDQYKGRKYLLLGNHDLKLHKKGKLEAMGFEAIFVGNFGMDLAGHRVQCSHYPYWDDNSKDQRYPDLRPRPDGFTLLHGHTHSPDKIHRYPDGTFSIHVGVDAWDYTPVHVDQISALIHELKKPW